MSSDGFRPVGRRHVARVGFLTIEQLHLRTPGGGGVSRVLVGHPGAVAIVPVVDEHVVLIRQYRSAVDGPLLEIPAGKIDVPGEAPEKTARRELQEEVGFDAGSLRHLASIYTTPGFSDEVIHLYVASDLRRVAAVPHGAEEEAAQIVRVPIAKLRGLMTSGEICDAKTLVGLGMFLLERA